MFNKALTVIVDTWWVGMYLDSDVEVREDQQPKSMVFRVSALPAASRAGSKAPFLARLCPPPDVGKPWCEACRMRLREEVSQASRVGLAGRMLGDAQQACCKRARGLTVSGAGGAGMREGRSLYTWLPVHSCRDAVPLRPFSSDCCASDLSIG